MTNKKTKKDVSLQADSPIWEDERFVMTKWEQKQKEQIESVRRTLASFTKSDKLTPQEAIREMIDFAYTFMLQKTIKERNI